MPVLEHEIHPSVKVGPEHRYGCWNRPRPEKLVNLGGFNSGLRINRMSRECRFDMSLSDPNCSGCAHRGSGEDYDAKVRGNGK